MALILYSSSNSVHGVFLVLGPGQLGCYGVGAQTVLQRTFKRIDTRIIGISESAGGVIGAEFRVRGQVADRCD
jgi:hypothetical protein